MNAENNSNRKTIVAIHGAGMHGGIWGAITPHVLDYRFRALSLPGHAPDDNVPLLSDIGAMAAWVRGKIAGMDNVVLLGHSMGALVAAAAADVPAVTAVVLMGAAPLMPVNPDLLATAKDDPAAAAALIRKWGIYSKNPQYAAVDAVVTSVMSSTNSAAIYADLAACDVWKNMESDLRAAEKPLLVLAGATDKMARPDTAQDMAAAAGGRFVLLADCGHMVMTEKPIDSALEIKKFLA
jgi:pimeloyl-ACP methyl ester carboxylesterase